MWQGRGLIKSLPPACPRLGRIRQSLAERRFPNRLNVSSGCKVSTKPPTRSKLIRKPALGDVFSFVRITGAGRWSKRYTWGSHPPDTVRSPSFPPPCTHAWGWLAGGRILNIEKSAGQGRSLLQTGGPHGAFACSKLLANEMGGDGAGVGRTAVFPEVNALPGAQHQLAVTDGNGKVDGGKRGAHMSGHIVVALAGVREERVAVRHKAGEEMLQVTPHVRVGVLLDQQGGGGMAEVEGHQAGSETALGNPVSHLAGDLVEAAATRGNGYLMQGLAQHLTQQSKVQSPRSKARSPKSIGRWRRVLLRRAFSPVPGCAGVRRRGLFGNASGPTPPGAAAG